ncbi:MAG: SDR family oxidoreductase, partial [Sphingomonas sp.]
NERITKAAVNMLTRTAAAEFGADGIRVNAVAPGFVDTPMVAYRYRDANGGVDEGLREALLQSRAAGSPLGRTGTPRDIALAVLYLASDAARFVTGQVVRANGGVSMP